MNNSRRLIACLALLILALPAAGDELRDPEVHFFEQTFGDMAEELETALAEGKAGVMIMFETADCPWCKRMMETVLNRASVQDYFREHFRIIAIDAEGDTPVVSFDGTETIEKEFALAYNRVRATPTFVFVGSGGEVLARYTGTTRSAEEFLWLGEYVTGGHYRTQRFTGYKRQRQADSG